MPTADQPAGEWWRKWRARQGPYRFTAARRAELQYARALRRIAAAIDAIVRGFVEPDATEIPPDVADRIVTALNKYSTLIPEWAEAVSRRLIADVSDRDKAAWSGLSREIGVALRHEIETAPTGVAMRQLLQDQVHLITSLPREAAERVHKLTTEALPAGRRYSEIIPDILASGDVTRSRAELIARTETARTASTLTTVRAQAIGCTQFMWVTAKDKRVRPLHKKLHGKVFEFDDPPVIGEKGERGLPGTIYNCRCVLSPIIPQHFFGQSAPSTSSGQRPSTSSGHRAA